MKVSVTNIEYDKDGEEIDLPTELNLELNTLLNAEEIEEKVSDEISNITGYCHTGFSMTIEKMSSDFYIRDGGNRCPHCRSNNISGRHIETDDASAWRVVECEDCEKSWTEVFTMTSMDIELE